MAKPQIKSSSNLLDFDIRKAQIQRLENIKVQQALFGLIAYFEDNQIRDRQGHYSSLYHSSNARKKSRSRITVWPRGLMNKHGISLPTFLRVRNLEGEWASQLHAMPELFLTGNKRKSHFSVQDSNLLTTATCALALSEVSEKKLTREQKVIQPIISEALNCLDNFKNGASYNFWPSQNAVYGNTNRRGPMNIRVEFTKPLASLLTKRGPHYLFRNLTLKLNIPSLKWIQTCLEDPKNNQGADAIFNLANDSGDTALALLLRYSSNNGKVTREMREGLNQIKKFRDLNREDDESNRFVYWKKNNSGAYLTWLKAEDKNPFGKPELGLIPGGFNNVDAVVNANIVYALSTMGETDTEGYREGIDLLCEVINQKTWPGAGLHSPQRMMFPYAASRALRNSGEKKVAEARQKLMTDVLKLVETKKSTFYFSGGKDKSIHLSTALGALTLLNLGEASAREAGKLKEFQVVLQGSIDFLLSQARYHGSHFKSTREKFFVKYRQRFIPYWEDGLFSAPSHWDLCHWRSQAITHAYIMNALSHYLLAYDKGANLCGKNLCQLSIRSYDMQELINGNWIRISQ